MEQSTTRENIRISNDLGTFERFSFRGNCAILRVFSAQDVIDWDHDEMGEAEFWPAGDKPVVALCFQNSTVTAHELLALDRLLGELGGESNFNFLRIHYAVQIYGANIVELACEELEDQCNHIFEGTGPNHLGDPGRKAWLSDPPASSGVLMMQSSRHAVSLEEQIEQWRSYLRRRQATHSVDLAELENNLRQKIAGLVDAGLAPDEAFLIAVKRMGSNDALSREFARENSNRLWKQLLLGPPDSGELRGPVQTDVIVAFCLAVAAAIAMKVPALFGLQLDEHKDADVRFYLRNASLLESKYYSQPY